MISRGIEFNKLVWIRFISEEKLGNDLLLTSSYCYCVISRWYRIICSELLHIMATSTGWFSRIKRHARISTEWLRGIKLTTIGRMTHVNRISCKSLSWVKLSHTVLPCIKQLSALKTWLLIYNSLIHISSIVLIIKSLVHRLPMLV